MVFNVFLLVCFTDKREIIYSIILTTRFLIYIYIYFQLKYIKKNININQNIAFKSKKTFFFVHSKSHNLAIRINYYIADENRLFHLNF